MILSVALALASAIPQKGIGHVRSVLPSQGDLLALEFADVDGDGRLDLFACYRENGRRELRIFRLRPNGAYPGKPDHVVEMKKDVISWGLGEFRPEEPGVELLLTTRNGAYTLSPRKSSYGGNIRKIDGAEFLLDVPAERSLPFWPAVADVNGDGVDEVALATVSGLRVVNVAGEVLGEVSIDPRRGRRPAAERSFQIGPAVLSSEPLADLMVPDEDLGLFELPPALYAEETLPIPMLADADGDGLLDLFYEWNGNIEVHLQTRVTAGSETQSRFSTEPSRSYSVRGGDWDLNGLQLVDAGGGPAVDLLLTRSESETNLTVDWQVLLYMDPFQSEAGLGQPDSLISVDASFAAPSLVSLRPRGERPDLAVSAWSLKLSALGLQGVDIKHVVTGYRTEGQESHEDRAVFRYERSYSADDFTAFSLVPPLSADLNGDGRTDLMESDPNGRLEIRPLQGRSDAMSFAQSPVARIEVDALASRVEVKDLDRDGVGDLVVLHSETLEIYLARKS